VIHLARTNLLDANSRDLFREARIAVSRFHEGDGNAPGRVIAITGTLRRADDTGARLERT
jgi:hypothetical protein